MIALGFALFVRMEYTQNGKKNHLPLRVFLVVSLAVLIGLSFFVSDFGY